MSDTIDVPRLTKVVAWTRAYNPFILGGSCHYLLGSRVKCDPPVPIGKGFHGCLIRGPEGLTKVVEPVSGGVIGDTIEDVMRDVAECDDVSLMRGQIEKASAERTKKGLKMVSPEEFWKAVREAKS